MGHMGLKFAKAFGAHVVLFTTSPHKPADGVRLGADEVIVSTDAAAMESMPAASISFWMRSPPITI